MAQQNVAVAVTTVILNETPNQVAAGVCNWAHHWEELNSTSYVTSGVLSDKSCWKCGVEFRDGPRIQSEKGYWPSGTNIASHCMKCDICVCWPCRVADDEEIGSRVVGSSRSIFGIAINDC